MRKSNRELRGLSGLVNGPLLGTAIWALALYVGWLWIDAIRADSALFVRDIKKEVAARLGGE